MRSRAAAAAAVLLVLLAACDGQPEGREPREWASETCTNLRSWMEALQTRSQEYTEALGQIEGADVEAVTPEVRSETVSLIDDVVEETDRLLNQIDEAGRPALEDGQEVVETFRDGIGELRTALVDSREDIAEARPANIQQRLEEFGATIQSAVQRVEGIFDRAEGEGLGGEELDRAFEEEPACAELQDAGGA